MHLLETILYCSVIHIWCSVVSISSSRMVYFGLSQNKRWCVSVHTNDETHHPLRECRSLICFNHLYTAIELYGMEECDVLALA